MHTAEITCKVPIYAEKTSYGIHEFDQIQESLATIRFRTLMN